MGRFCLPKATSLQTHLLHVSSCPGSICLVGTFPRFRRVKTELVGREVKHKLTGRENRTAGGGWGGIPCLTHTHTQPHLRLSEHICCPQSTSEISQRRGEQVGSRPVPSPICTAQVLQVQRGLEETSIFTKKKPGHLWLLFCPSTGLQRGSRTKQNRGIWGRGENDR